MARDMVMRYGMSEALGVMVYGENEGEVFLGRAVTRTTHVSEVTMQKVDAEIRRMLEEQYARATKLLEDNRDKVELMVECLMKWESIDADQIADIMTGMDVRPPKEGASVKTTEPLKPKKTETLVDPAPEVQEMEEKAAAHEAEKPTDETKPEDKQP
jgi:cell division protease FtsH